MFKGVRLPQQSKERAALVALNSRDDVEKVGRTDERAPKSELPDLVGELGDPLEVIENTISLLLRQAVDDHPNLLDQFLLLVVPIDFRSVVSTFVKIGFQTFRLHPPEKFRQTEAHPLVPDIVGHSNRCATSRTSTPAYKGALGRTFIFRCPGFRLDIAGNLPEFRERLAQANLTI